MSDEARYYRASREARRAWEQSQPQLAFDLWGLDEHQAAKALSPDGGSRPGEGRHLMLVEPVTDGASNTLPHLPAPALPPVAGSIAREETPAPVAALPGEAGNRGQRKGV